MTIGTNAPACLILADGSKFFGETIGTGKTVIGEICFNTGMVGYQETLTDPSYAGQIITFTFPHIGNVGCNKNDIESEKVAAGGLVIREPITQASNYRSQQNLNDWLIANNVMGICGVDTRALTRHIRKNGAQNAMILSLSSDGLEADEAIKEALEELRRFPSMEGLELAKSVTSSKSYQWNQREWSLSPSSFHTPHSTLSHVVAIDYGIKYNILRCLTSRGCKVTVVPATTTAEEILSLKPDGIFLSNGPGDPAATSVYTTPILQTLMVSGTPIFGICLGHQLLALSLGGKTAKMPQGHRGANHPVKNLATGAVEITSQNHGFAVLAESLPKGVTVTHTSLFDGTVEGLRVENKPIFSVQYHPESSPGPHDSAYLFDEFVKMMNKNA